MTEEQSEPDGNGGSGPRAPHRDDDHRWPHPFLYLVPVLVVCAVALVLARIEPSAPDAFYNPPTELPSGSPGSVIASRPIPGAPPGSKGWTVMYRSTNLDGSPRATTARLFVPTTPAPPGGRKVVAWAHGTSGVARRCAPSMRPGTAAATDIPGFDALIADGYAIAATDYPGLGTPGPHPYLVGESEGVAVLDSVRAAHAFAEAEASTTFAVWGHSQGGHAALFAGQLAPTYAPELTLVGVATAAPATELRDLLAHDIGGAAGNVLASMAIVSWTDVYAAQGLEETQLVQPTGLPLVRLIADGCVETIGQVAVDLPEAELLGVQFKGVDMRDHTWSPPPAWEPVLAQNTPGGAPIRVPLLVSQGTADTIVWPGITAGWVAGRCAAGEHVQETLYDGASHLQVATEAAPATVTWLGARFAGAPAPTNCPSRPT